MSSLGKQLGYAELYLFFLFLVQNINCGYSLEGFDSVPTIDVLNKNKKKMSSFFLLKMFIFYNFLNLCILQVHIFVNGITAHVEDESSTHKRDNVKSN